jgi:hypothetical protein
MGLAGHGGLILPTRILLLQLELLIGVPQHLPHVIGLYLFNTFGVQRQLPRLRSRLRVHSCPTFAHGTPWAIAGMSQSAYFVP